MQQPPRYEDSSLHKTRSAVTCTPSTSPTLSFTLFLRRWRIRISWVVDGRSGRTTTPIHKTRPHLCNRSHSLLFRGRRQERWIPRSCRCGAVVACSRDQAAHRVLHVIDTVVGNPAVKGVCVGGIVLASAKFGVDVTTCSVSVHCHSRDINTLGKEKN